MAINSNSPIDIQSLFWSGSTFGTYILANIDGNIFLKILEFGVALTALLVNGFKMYDWVKNTFFNKPKNKKDEKL